MIQDIAWSPRLVGTTTATAASAADVTAGTSTSTFITPAALAGSSPTLGGNLTVSGTGTSSFAGVAQFAATKGVTFNSSTDVGTYGIGFKNDGSVYPIRVALANDAITQRRFQVGYYSTDTQAGTWTNSFEVNSYNGNTTLAGNLTVSGGTLLFNQASAQYQTFNVNSGGTGDQVEIKYQQVGNGRAGIYFGTAVGGSGYMRVQVGSGGGTTALLANSTGNVLIGTTSDGGQKLQVAGTGIFSSTESAVTLYATASGGYAYQLISGGNLGHALGAFKIVDSSTGYVVLNHDKPTSGGTRLSFDGAGNATFAGNIVIDKATPSILIKRGANTQDGLIAFATGGNGDFSVGNRGTSDSDLHIYNFGLAADAVTISKNTSNATFAGDVTVSGGNLGVGSAATSIRSIICGGTLSGGSVQNGIYIGSAAGTDATSEYSGITIQPTASAGSYTIGSGYGISIATPSIGTSAAITTQLGLYIANQGVSGKTTNAYGIKIAAQSGAATTNIGLLNLGATVLATPAAAVTLADNSTMTFELTSNTSLTIKVRGTDGTTRSVALTLA